MWQRWTRLPLVGLTLAALASTGCGGNTGAFLTSNGINGVPPPVSTNAVQGRLTLTAGTSPTVSLFLNTAVGVAPTPLGTVTPAADGSFSLAGLGDGSYTLVLSGSGVRPQSDNFVLVGGQTVTANYTVSALTGAPSKQELQGFATELAHLTRSFYGPRGAVPLAGLFNQATLPLQRSQSAPGAAFPTTNIAVPFAAADAVDSIGQVWVSTSNGNGTVLLSNTGSVLGTFSGGTGVVGPNGVAVDANNDVVVIDNGFSATLFPQDSHSGTVIGTSTVQFFGVVPQNGPVTLGNQTISTPHLLAFSVDNIGDITGSGQVDFAKNLSGLNGGGLRVVTAGAVNPADNTFWFTDLLTPTGSKVTTPELIQVDANLTTVLHEINLVSVAGLANTDTINELAFDGNSNLFLATSSGSRALVKLTGGTTFATAVASGGTVTFGQGASTVAVDVAGNVWATPANGTTAVRFDNNLDTGNATSVTVESNPTSIALDSHGNAFVVGSGGVTRIAVAANVVPFANGTFTLPDGGFVRVTVVGGVVTFTETFPGNVPALTFTASNLTTANGITTFTLQGVSAFGPTASTIKVTENSNTGVTTYVSQSISAFDGVKTTTTTTVNPDGSETVTASTSNGESYTLTYSAPSGNGTTMAGNFTNTTTGANLTVTALFNNDGSLGNYTVNDIQTGLSGTGTMSAQGSWTTTISQNGTVQANATDTQLQDVVTQFVAGGNGNASNNFQLFQVATNGTVNYLNTGITGTFSDQTTFTDSGSQFNDQTPANSGNFTTGQGDGNTNDSGTGAGTYIAFDGGGGVGSGIRIIRH